MKTQHESRTGRWAKGAALVAVGAIGATALTGLALADDSSDATPPGPADEQGFGPGMGGHGGPGGHGGHGGPGKGGFLGGPGAGPMLHGEGVVSDGEGGTYQVQVQTGTVASASDTSITVTSEDGYESTFAIDGDTRVMRDHETVSGSDLQVGDTVRVFASDEDGSLVAVHVGALSEEAAAEREQRRAERQEFREERMQEWQERFGDDSSST